MKDNLQSILAYFEGGPDGIPEAVTLNPRYKKTVKKLESWAKSQIPEQIDPWQMVMAGQVNILNEVLVADVMSKKLPKKKPHSENAHYRRGKIIMRQVLRGYIQRLAEKTKEDYYFNPTNSNRRY